MHTYKVCVCVVHVWRLTQVSVLLLIKQLHSFTESDVGEPRNKGVRRLVGKGKPFVKRN